MQHELNYAFDVAKFMSLRMIRYFPARRAAFEQFRFTHSLIYTY